MGRYYSDPRYAAGDYPSKSYSSTFNYPSIYSRYGFPSRYNPSMYDNCAGYPDSIGNDVPYMGERGRVENTYPSYLKYFYALILKLSLSIYDFSYLKSEQPSFHLRRLNPVPY